MRKQVSMLLGLLCYVLGVILSLYVGLYRMLLIPAQTLYVAFTSGNFDLGLLFGCGLQIVFSSTFAGLIWCIGYMGYNHFKGTEDPDWDAIAEERRIV